MPQRHLVLLFLIISLYHHHHQCSTSLITDTITPTQPLKDDGQVLTSQDANNNFALGFFSPGNTTRHRYIGVWYNKISIQTVVWVANRDRPINSSDGILSITKSGNLVLSSGNSTVWSAQISPHNIPSIRDDQFSPKAQLLGSGNLVLTLGGGTSSQNAAWQSFDYPANVWLPEMALGLNRKTGFNRSLSAWRSKDDPGHGNYTLRAVGLDGEYFMCKVDGTSEVVWRSGPWVGDRWSGHPEMTRNFIFNYTYVDSPDETYFTFYVRNASIATMFMLVLDGESGTLERKTWHQNSQEWIRIWAAPVEDCDHYANCGAFGLCTPQIDQFVCSCFAGYEPKSPKDWYLRDGSEGCVRAGNVSMCGNAEGFLKLANVKLPDTSRAKTNMSMSLEECRNECLNNCSCSAFTTATDGRSDGVPHGCRLFYGDLVDTRVYAPGGGQDLFFRVDAVELAKNFEKSEAHLNKRHLAILVVCITFPFTLAISFATWFYRKKRRECKEQQQRSLWLGEVEESNSSLEPAFQHSAIVVATQNFDPTNLLGEGGFGPVYKGTLSSGKDIAVKRLSKNSRQGINEFKNEVRLISKLQHRNLVKTLGYCVKGDDKMLVYEFLPNKSLDNYIFNKEKKAMLDWRKRYEIITGIARGILYLHQDSTLKIIHRDLKVGNILLDAKMTPKISDFGLARIFGSDQSEANTGRVVGTYGYMSPEYAMEGHFSIKSDVFSFGIICLEIISGKKSIGYYNVNVATNLSCYVWKLWQVGNLMEIIDESIVSTICGFEDEILRCIQIGLLCVQENPNERPTMSEVIFMLSNKSKLPSPKEPAFIKGNNHKNEDPMSSSIGPPSVNEVTITMVDAR